MFSADTALLALLCKVLWEGLEVLITQQGQHSHSAAHKIIQTNKNAPIKLLSNAPENRPFFSLLYAGCQLVNVYKISSGCCAAGAPYLSWSLTSSVICIFFFWCAAAHQESQAGSSRKWEAKQTPAGMEGGGKTYGMPS